MSEPLHVISLGAGVQSSTMALMAAAGEITPMPVAAIFADTQAEPASVYRWLEWLEKQLPFPVCRVSAGNLGDAGLRIRISKAGNRYVKTRIPAYLNVGGMWTRQCTQDFKLVPIDRETRRLMREAGTKKAVQWLGISLDEVQRMRDPRTKKVDNRYPLIERRMRRHDCLKWMAANGFPTPPRSACVFCPYHHDREWLRLKREEPAEFERAVVYERELQAAAALCDKAQGVPFLHSSLRPLDVALLDSERQTEMFGNDCSGVCGV